MKYRVYLKTEIIRDVDDETEQGAIKWAMETPELGKSSNPIVTAICKLRSMEEGEDGDDESDHKDVEGHCEACDKVILEGDDHSVVGEDRYYLCHPCAEQARKEFQRHVENGVCGYCGLNAILPDQNHCVSCSDEG